MKSDELVLIGPGVLRRTRTTVNGYAGKGSPDGAEIPRTSRCTPSTVRRPPLRTQVAREFARAGRK